MKDMAVVVAVQHGVLFTEWHEVQRWPWSDVTIRLLLYSLCLFSLYVCAFILFVWFHFVCLFPLCFPASVLFVAVYLLRRPQQRTCQNEVSEISICASESQTVSCRQWRLPD